MLRIAMLVACLDHLALVAVGLRTITGFSNWKHATGSNGKLLMHNNCIAHKQATVAWEQYKSTSKTGSIADQLGNKREEMIQKNRHYIKTVAEVLLLCSQQDVPLRGHDESLTSAILRSFSIILPNMIQSLPRS